MSIRLLASLPAVFCALLLLAGCGETTDVAQGARAAQGVRQAVQQDYTAGNVEVSVYQQNGGRRLEVNLINPDGEEVTNQAAARRVAQSAYGAYEGSSLDTVRVSFEHSTQRGAARTGLHRRYSFAPGEIEGGGQVSAADTTAS